MHQNQAIRCDQGMKFVQDLTSKSVRFSGESTALGIGEANASPTQALREHAVLFLEIRDHLQLMALDPPGEHHEQQLKRLKRWGHCSGVYGLTNRPGSSSSRLAHCPIASFEFLDTTGSKEQWPIWDMRSGAARSPTFSENTASILPLSAISTCRGRGFFELIGNAWWRQIFSPSRSARSGDW